MMRACDTDFDCCTVSWAHINSALPSSMNSLKDAKMTGDQGCGVHLLDCVVGQEVDVILEDFDLDLVY